MQLPGAKFDVRMGLELRDGVRSVRQEGMTHRLGGLIAHGMAQVKRGFLDAVLPSDRSGMGRIRNPGAPGGIGRGSSDLVGALDQDRLEPCDGGEQRGGHSGAARTDHDGIIFLALGHIQQSLRAFGQTECASDRAG